MSIFQRLATPIKRLRKIAQIEVRLERLQLLLGSLVERIDQQFPPQQLNQTEFCVFSQFGDDGIISFLTRALEPLPHSFIEFGVEDYSESNTRYLLMQRGWRGLVIDGSETHISTIKAAPYFWRHELTAISAFITAENINQLISQAGFARDLGLLSVDIDGMDYWVWRAIKNVRPAIVVAEYNAVFGGRSKVTVPYCSTFTRTAADTSNLYFGASFGALSHLAESKGYFCIGTNLAGNNAYFIDESFRARVPFEGPNNLFTNSQFRESRGPGGELTLLAGGARLAPIRHLPVVDVTTGETLPLGEAVDRAK